MPQIDGVLFDYGLVLSGPQDPAAWASMVTSLRSDEPSLAASYWKHRNEYDRGELNGLTYWHAVASDLGQTLNDGKLASLQADDVRLWTQPNSEMISWAARLQRAGVKTGILSNIGDAMESGILAQAQWIKGFAHHTFSHRLGIAKPELAIYRQAAAGLGVATKHILFIDDREENISGAEAAGMHALQYVNHEQFVDAMRSRGFGALLEI